MKPKLIEIWEKHGEIVSTVQAKACFVSHKPLLNLELPPQLVCGLLVTVPHFDKQVDFLEITRP